MDKKEILSRIATKIKNSNHLNNRLSIIYNSESEFHYLEIDKDTNTIWIKYGLNQFPGFQRIGDKIIELEKVSDEELLYIYREVIPYYKIFE